METTQYSDLQSFQIALKNKNTGKPLDLDITNKEVTIYIRTKQQNFKNKVKGDVSFIDGSNVLWAPHKDDVKNSGIHYLTVKITENNKILFSQVHKFMIEPIQIDPEDLHAES